MGTTLNDELARIGSDRVTCDLEATLDHVHRSLADTVALLDLEIEGLWRNEPDVDDVKRYDKLRALIREANKVKMQIVEVQAKAGMDDNDETTALNLKEARDEIMRRLARLAAIEGQDEIPG